MAVTAVPLWLNVADQPWLASRLVPTARLEVSIAILDAIAVRADVQDSGHGLTDAVFVTPATRAR